MGQFDHAHWRSWKRTRMTADADFPTGEADVSLRWIVLPKLLLLTLRVEHVYIECGI